jgi:hypothetical protein
MEDIDISWLEPPTGSVGFYKGRPIVPVAVRDYAQISSIARTQI